MRDVREKTTRTDQGKGKRKRKGKGKGQSNGQGNRRLHFCLQGYAFREHVVYNGSRAPSSLFSLSLYRLQSMKVKDGKSICEWY